MRDTITKFVDSHAEHIIDVAERKEQENLERAEMYARLGIDSVHNPNIRTEIAAIINFTK